ncbi:SDR family NAD(P)-dependent oxidoreductase [Flaviflexus sp.]|uniref:SDR family NAD(P)-dependent oxidoreductase n=1 Tax=Flaviflexus sp. TaxID=1969482 RepID=UPI003F90064F
MTGAGNGMGEATTKLFAEEGATVYGVDIKSDALKKWEDNPNVIPVVADLLDNDDIENLFNLVKVREGKLDILANIAGINDLCYPLLDTTEERWDMVIDLDLKVPFLLSQKAVEMMLPKESGVIINVGSDAAYRGNHGPSYSAAKHGLMGLTFSVAAGYADKGIRCNAINPGGVNTNIAENSGGEYHEEGMKWLGMATGNVPVPYGEPIEIARAALWLSVDEAHHINGALVPVDAGLSAF